MHALKQPQAKSTTSSSVGLRSAGLIQRKCACGGNAGPTGECEQCRQKRDAGMLQRRDVQPSTFNPQDSPVPPIIHEVLRSPGQPLDAETRAFMEPRFGHDFRQVRIHSDGTPLEQRVEQTLKVRPNAYGPREAVSLLAPGSGPSPVPPSTQNPTGPNLPKGNKACVKAQRIPANRSGVVNLGGEVREQFLMAVDWENDPSRGCDCACV